MYSLCIGVSQEKNEDRLIQRMQRKTKKKNKVVAVVVLLLLVVGEI